MICVTLCQVAVADDQDPLDPMTVMSMSLVGAADTTSSRIAVRTDPPVSVNFASAIAVSVWSDVMDVETVDEEADDLDG